MMTRIMSQFEKTRKVTKQKSKRKVGLQRKVERQAGCKGKPKEKGGCKGKRGRRSRRGFAEGVCSPDVSTYTPDALQAA
jgi:hypothetical protein